MRQAVEQLRDTALNSNSSVAGVSARAGRRRGKKEEALVRLRSPRSLLQKLINSGCGGGQSRLVQDFIPWRVAAKAKD